MSDGTSDTSKAVTRFLVNVFVRPLIVWWAYEWVAVEQFGAKSIGYWLTVLAVVGFRNLALPMPKDDE